MALIAFPAMSRSGLDLSQEIGDIELYTHSRPVRKDLMGLLRKRLHPFQKNRQNRLKPVIIAENKLRNVRVQILRADTVICSVNTSL